MRMSVALASGLRADSRVVPLVVIPEDQCRIKREAKQKMRLTSEQSRRSSRSPQQAVSSSDSQDCSLSVETRELINRIVAIDAQFAVPSSDSLMKILVCNILSVIRELTEVPSFLYISLRRKFVKDEGYKEGCKLLIDVKFEKHRLACIYL